jgi:hypothetical protein
MCFVLNYVDMEKPAEAGYSCLMFKEIFGDVTAAEWVQFLIALGFGLISAQWAISIGANPKAPLIAALIGGYVGLKGTMFLYVWLRYGWASARSLCLYGNEA